MRTFRTGDNIRCFISRHTNVQQNDDIVSVKIEYEDNIILFCPLPQRVTLVVFSFFLIDSDYIRSSIWLIYSLPLLTQHLQSVAVNLSSVNRCICTLIILLIIRTISSECVLISKLCRILFRCTYAPLSNPFQSVLILNYRLLRLVR